MALTQLKTGAIADDAVTTDKLANAINTERTANTAKVQTTINNNADNRVITGSGTANTLEGEANLTFDGTRLNVATGDLAVTGAEGGDAQLRLTADEGDDGADYWRLESKASDNTFNLATYGSGAWVNKVTVNTDGDVLIGRTSTIDASEVLGLKGPDSEHCTLGITSDGTAQAGIIAFNDDDATFRGRIQYNHSDDSMQFRTAATEHLRILSDGKIGIGRNNPAHLVHAQINNTTDYDISTATTNTALMVAQAGTGGANHGVGIGLNGGSSNGEAYITLVGADASNSDLRFGMRSGGSRADRLVITHDGKVGIGTTSPDYLFNVVSDSIDMCRFQQTTNNQGDDYNAILIKHAAALSGQNGVGIRFQNSGGTTVGKINIGQSTTGYETSSDYRLKENAEAISDGITRLKTLKPYRFNWIAEKGQPKVDGFFAHEVTAVPEAIGGTKDAVDSDNNPIYQGIDQSKLVPLLTAALQEAIAKIETLETKVAALEAG